MEDVCNDDDLDVSEEAEQDLQDWAMEPFLEIFEKLEPCSNQQQMTLQDYLSPETYRYQVYGQDGKLQPFLDYNVPPSQISDGIFVDQSKLSSQWHSFRPKDIKIECPSMVESLSQFPRKVSAAGTVYHFKPVYSGNQPAALREIDIYRKLDDILPCDEIRVPALHAVVRDESGSVLIGLLLSWIECGTENLECILMSEMPLSSSLREKWRMQITTTVTKLHEAGIVWGDAKAANILIDSKDNAWIIDFGGGFTEGWVEKSQMDTIEGDLTALVIIEELLQPEKTQKKRALEESDGTQATKKPFEVRVDAVDC
ncbi:hypothetical protein ANOM_008635 [Aspergillus nomiae NRRL 13137]|uniref:Protein kinase domain-containing protein n=1 Tax=Aspergillus nomiae NRRL (strain ATCC 15546 / NRRL 13137 / CBS 260.88 / M93) TaxID=1509407 RepID=A0A0L1ITN2_ASPN3|nr:uncharacterized protein ANOM_008635 [Aspergillus nomiae NRRL 13137]KNG82849.1 hypothetical protein ANOM_008635 [Aspergillus nomiae NRRL 13137]